MRPLRLTMRAYGPYASEQVVDFDRLGTHGLFLIHGRTGSGKSTVLDAMCFALYGKSSGEERLGRDAVSTLDPYGGTVVELEFEHVGRRYRVRRGPDQERLKKRGDGTTAQPHWAELLDVTDGKDVVADKASAVTTTVTELLRCDADQFRQTIVLPQGEFRKVVTDDKSRRSILSNVFSTHRFERLVAGLKAKHNSLLRDGQANENTRREILEALEVADRDEGSELLVQAKKAEAGASAEKKRLDSAKLTAQAAMTAGTVLADDFAALAEARRESAELEARVEEMKVEEATLAAARRAAGLVDVRRSLAEKVAERDELAEALAEAKTEAAEAEARLASAEEASQALEPEAPRLKKLEKEASRLEHLEPTVRRAAETRTELETAKRAHQDAQAELETVREELAEADEAVKDAQLKLSLAGAAAGELHEARDRKRVATENLEAAQRLAEHAKALSRAEVDLEEISRRGDPLDAALAQIALHAPSLLAEELAEGDACPVCGSTEHPAPAHGDGPGSVTEALAQLGAGASRVAELRGSMRDLQRRTDEILTARGWNEAVPEEDDLRAGLARAEAAVTAAEGAAAEVKGLEADVARLDAAVKSLTAQVEQRAVAERQAAERVVELNSAAEAAVSGLPADLRAPDAFAQALQLARQAHEELAERFKAAADALEAAKQAVKDTRKDEVRLTGRLKTAEEALAGRAAEFEERLTGSGFASLEELDAAALPLEEFEEREAELKRYGEDRLAAASSVSALEKKLKGREQPDLEALGRALEGATSAADAAAEAWRSASNLTSSVAESLRRYDALLKEDSALEARKRAAKRLYDLATGQVKGESRMDLQTFVLRSIFGEVLTHGNVHLRHMTGGRYQLALKEPESASDTGLELNVHDSFSGGAVRPVRTLSGGEGFLASLALALGLAEVAQQQSGAVDHGALFIDEGFGSLDPAALDNAVDILRGLQQSHRMVGIISHVDELKKRIPVQLLVEAGDKGSTLQVRVNA